MPNITTEELQAVLQQLEQAIYNHEQWAKSFDRTLICRGSHNPRDIEDNAHHLCPFGQWYYQLSPDSLRQLPAFQAIGLEHKQMHRQATQLLRVSLAGGGISPQDYDLFANAMERLRLEIHTLKRELAETLYNRDPLTGANTRTGLLTKLREQQELVRRGVQPCAIVMMDLDHFKSVNDTYGHSTGDRVLVAITGYVIEHLRPYDKLFRYGGEEFVICLPGLELEVAREVIERLRQGVAANPIETAGGQPIQVSASFGFTMIASDISVEESLDRADSALYQAKNEGRNCTRSWKPGLEA
ncbi:MAG: hypothetical protein A2286_01360 [Gammaproteobacteria bacterium RIFOXYA12_FULL_61_12]|nr:MAG: hypothetical protein A2286_01360 [Gammaproteobacteria bacterium RIFOXYA12_FULL_61_12]OGT89964.1 MAG: hypothetical protein A2514_10465 [Gammaproteobacteria bacterium RIFOXYD12_FULL_61_37]